MALVDDPRHTSVIITDIYTKLKELAGLPEWDQAALKIMAMPGNERYLGRVAGQVEQFTRYNDQAAEEYKKLPHREGNRRKEKEEKIRERLWVLEDDTNHEIRLAQCYMRDPGQWKPHDGGSTEQDSPPKYSKITLL